MIDIIPSILVKTKRELLDKINILEPLVERAHIDVADGIFVPNMTIDGAEELENIETTLDLGVHLMVSKPENHIHKWLDTPVRKIIFHIEATEKPQTVIDEILEIEGSIGIALNPETPISAIESFIEQIDFIHVMTVSPGFYGSPFQEIVIEKIKDIHYFYPDKPIEVDGGVNPETAPKLIEAGASILVVGSYLFENKDINKSFENLKESINL